MRGPLHFRVFISSPGDVGEERAAARSISEQLSREALLAGRVSIEVVAWDHPEARAPLSAAESPQESVQAYKTAPCDCDLTVVILWSRLGTALPQHIRRPDGTHYASGTEWELEDARQAGKPVFVYHRQEKPRLEIDDPDQAEKQRQYGNLKGFVAALKGKLAAGINEYAAAQDFAQLFKQHLAAEIRRRLDSEPRHPSTPPPSASKTFRVFIGTAANDMFTSRVRLVNELRTTHQIEVLDETPPPLEQLAHRAKVLESLGRADLCVNLLGHQSGAPVDWEEPDWTYPLEQAQLALAGDRPQVILQPPSFSLEGVPSPKYREFLERLNASKHPQSRLELVRCGSQQMVESILAKRHQIEEARRRAKPRSGTAVAFVDAHTNDMAFASKLVRFLPQENVTPITIPPTPGVPTTPLGMTSLFAQNLRKAQLFLVIFGSVARCWVEERLNEALKLILSERLPTRIGVCVAPPHKASDQLSFPFMVLDSTSRFDELELRRFLDQADEAG